MRRRDLDRPLAQHFMQKWRTVWPRRRQRKKKVRELTLLWSSRDRRLPSDSRNGEPWPPGAGLPISSHSGRAGCCKNFSAGEKEIHLSWSLFKWKYISLCCFEGSHLKHSYTGRIALLNRFRLAKVERKHFWISFFFFFKSSTLFSGQFQVGNEKMDSYHVLLLFMLIFIPQFCV